jgi:hypothetical protein
MTESIQHKRVWVDPKLTVFGDVNGLTLSNKTFPAVFDGNYFTGGPFHHVPIGSS